MKQVRLQLTDEEAEILTGIAAQYGWRLRRFLLFLAEREVARRVSPEKRSQYEVKVRNTMVNERIALLMKNGDLEFMDG